MRPLAIRDRLRSVPWRIVLPAVVFVLAVIALVPPLRTAAANTTTAVILWVAAPLTPPVDDLDRLPETTRILASDGSLLAELDSGEDRTPVELGQLPDHVVQAVLAAEDQNFYEHGGVDLSAVLRATVRSVQGDRQGGSTITQQLAKLNYTGSERTFMRKLKELLYARRLEQRYSKDELLERYLNQVYLGDGAYGLVSGAEAFFGTTPDRLTPAQAALLAGKIRAPEILDPRRDPEAAKARRDAVLENMAENGYLTEDEAGREMAAPVELAPPKDGNRILKAPHFVEYVKREAKFVDALGGTPEVRGRQLHTGGYTIKTTLDPKAFDATVAAVQARLGAPGDPAVGVVSIQPGDGAIRNLFGGLDANRKFDVATQGKRQPGSAFKPFVYLAAIEAGIDPRSMLESSSPMTLDWKGSPYVVDNYEGKGGGPLSIDDGLVDSVNTVYAQLGIHVGPKNVVSAAEKAGIHEGIPPFPAVALGGLKDGVSPLEMAAAYASFAAKGTYAKPYAIESITDAEGEEIYRRRPETREVFDQRAVGNLNRPLQDVVRRGTGTAAAIGRPVAGKTGTTQNYTNGWFVGYTPQLATSVWVGDPDSDRPLRRVHGRPLTGGSFPAEVFADVMRGALAGVKVLPLHTATPESLSLQPLVPPTTTSTSTSTPTSTTSTSSVPVTTTTPPPTTETTTATTAPPTTDTTAPPSDGGGGGKSNQSTDGAVEASTTTSAPP